MILNETRTVKIKTDFYEGTAGLSETGEIAYFCPRPRYGSCDAVLDGEPVRLRLDASQWSKVHKIIYARVIEA